MGGADALTLRPARLHEARAMADMSRRLIESGLAWRYRPSRMAVLISDPETLAVVACDAARIQGFAMMQFGAERAHLVLLCVEPSQQRRGIGRRLDAWLLLSAQVAGMESVQLELRADNAPALAFYSRLGYAETQQVPGYYDGRLAARRMVRRLRPGTAMG